MNIPQYFDLNSRPGVAKAMPRQGGPGKPKAWPQWIALLLGVIVQPALAQYRVTGQFQFRVGWQAVLFAAIVAIVIFPAVYRAAFDPDSPWLVKIAPIFTAGLGWEALFGAAVKAAGAAVQQPPSSQTGAMLWSVVQFVFST
jgi:hypothetical protein